MEIDHPKIRAFLFELYTQTGGDIEAQVSIYDIGTAVGLEKNDIESMAQFLYIQGLAEMKTLSGGIGITVAGLEVLDIKVECKDGDRVQLSNTKHIGEADRAVVDDIIHQIKECVFGKKQNYNQMEELVIDIKCIEIQMLSPCPKTKVIRQLLVSCKDNLDSGGSSDLVKKLKVMLGS